MKTLPANNEILLRIEFRNAEGELFIIGEVGLDNEGKPFAFKETSLAAQRGVYNLLENIWPKE